MGLTIRIKNRPDHELTLSYTQFNDIKLELASILDKDYAKQMGEAMWLFSDWPECPRRHLKYYFDSNDTGGSLTANQCWDLFVLANEGKMENAFTKLLDKAIDHGGIIWN